MTRPLSFLSPTSLDLLLSMGLRIAARAVDSGKVGDLGWNKYHPCVAKAIRNLLEEYLERRRSP